MSSTLTGGRRPHSEDDQMNTTAVRSREFWRAVLLAGGSGPIPRWTSQPRVGLDEYEIDVPAGLAAEVAGAARRLGVPVSSVLLTAHTAVLASLTGERDVCAGLVIARNGAALPVRVDTDTATWRTLARAVDSVTNDAVLHGDHPVADLARELGLPEAPFDTEFDPEGVGGLLGDGTVVQVGLVRGDGLPATLRVRYRTEALDREAAARIADYHLSALAALVGDPDADHRRQTLLSAAEWELQLSGLAGPTRELPDLRVHQLFEQQAAAHPDAIAAVHRDQRWSYAQLNELANRLARALVARGLVREGVVAVVTERNLDWMAAVLAVFKAGGVYLPIEPHFPADRIAGTLSRSSCRLVLTERASRTSLAAALQGLPDVQELLLDEVHQEDHPADDLGLDVGADQLAYIYFTSGSTGQPKGAMCEHAGLVNHLLAKIDDLQVESGQVVAQTAPQCFDISLWQLVSAVLVGGTTLLVEQEVVLDVGRFVDTLVAGRVGVVQLVPSYLDVVVSHLEQHPTALPDLRCVSVTGEALKRELAVRWFAVQPGIALVNAYGLTETSDDTNHHVMREAPPEDRVPLGLPVQNVTITILNDHLDPVPLGAPGEITFSGVCVGRGYINDPDRTRAAFGDDPHRPGQRLYRSGDFGRWSPDGTLEFLGRRDSQVKIAGFRIEIGEIENALLQVPGVGDGAVVIGQRDQQSKRLVAFYSGPQEVDDQLLRDRLGAALPVYMVPTAFHWRPLLPLTANGKIDRKNLTAAAGQLVVNDDFDPPCTETEKRLAAAWAVVLGVPPHRIGRQDHFFDLGGTSLLAVKLAVTLKRLVSLKDVTRHPVLADLARLVDTSTASTAGLLSCFRGPTRPRPPLSCAFPMRVETR